MARLSYKVAEEDTKFSILKEDEPWSLPQNLKITPEGRLCAEAEPNLEEETVRTLMQTEADFLSKEQKEFANFTSEEDIVRTVFDAHEGIAMAHLTQCIRENKRQSYAELVGRFSEEKKIPFIMGVIYIRALEKARGLFYFDNSPRGFRRVRWAPVSAYVPPDTVNPPEKKLRRERKKPVQHPSQDLKYRILNCPRCGNPGQLVRCGKEGLFWQVCCTDPTCKCKNFAGAADVEYSKTEKSAVTAWNSYVEAYLEKKHKKKKQKEGEQ